MTQERERESETETQRGRQDDRGERKEEEEKAYLDRLGLLASSTLVGVLLHARTESVLHDGRARHEVVLLDDRWGFVCKRRGWMGVAD